MTHEGTPPLVSASAARQKVPGKPRARRTLRGWLLRMGLSLTAILLAIGCAAWSVGWRPWRPALPEPVLRGEVAKVRSTLNSQHAPRDLFADVARGAARGVVSIQTVGQANTRNLGAGFIVRRDGLVATNYHVVSSATEAQVRLPDGRSFAVSGYAAVSPEHDLAILKLAAPPEELAVLPLADFATQAKPASAVMAIGHPRGLEFSLFDGRVSRWVLTGDLDHDGQRFVKKLTGSSENLRWLQHTAALDEGNSGGPLIDPQGHVVGINTWIHRIGGLNYALDVRYLRELLSEVGEELTPLETLARSDVQAATLVSRLSSEHVDKLWSQVEAMQWLPVDELQYRAMSELSLAMVAAHLPESFQGDKRDAERWHQLQLAVTRIEEKLKARTKFGTPDQITIVNEQAEKIIGERHRGVFFFGEVERIVTGQQGQRGVLVKLIGSRQMVFFSLDGQFFDHTPGSVLAIFAVNLQGEVVRYGDNPLQLIAAPVLVSRTFLPVTGS